MPVSLPLTSSSHAMTDETKCILLTGASGYLGQHILKELVTTAGVTGLDLVDGEPSSSLHVYGLYGTNKEFPDAVQSLVENEKNDKVSVTTECLDLTNGDAVKAWLQNKPIRVCIHTAALSSPRVCQKDPTHAAAINIPQTLFDQLAAQGCRVIALSTDQVYQGTKKELYVETDPTEPVNVYGTTKLQMERVLSMRHDNAIILRASIILGQKAPLHGAAHDTFLHFCASREGQPTDFYTDEYRSVVFVQDVVYTIVWFTRQLLIRSSTVADRLSGVYNMGGPASVSRVDMAQAVFQHLGFDGAGSIVAKEKAKLPAGDVPSPLDISMDSSKLELLMQRKFASLNEILPAVFPR